MFTDNLWWFKPNEYTTRWELISHWVDEDRSTVYELVDGSWELTDSHDDRLIIETPSEATEGKFFVRIQPNKANNIPPIISFDTVYGNTSKSNPGTTVKFFQLKYQIADASVAAIGPFGMFYSMCDSSVQENINPGFEDTDASALIQFTSLTNSITFPSTLKQDTTLNSDFVGWGAINTSALLAVLTNEDTSILTPCQAQNGSFYMPVSLVVSRNFYSYPEIPTDTANSIDMSSFAKQFTPPVTTFEGLQRFVDIPQMSLSKIREILRNTDTSAADEALEMMTFIAMMPVYRFVPQDAGSSADVNYRFDTNIYDFTIPGSTPEPDPIPYDPGKEDYN